VAVAPPNDLGALGDFAEQDIQSRHELTRRRAVRSAGYGSGAGARAPALALLVRATVPARGYLSKVPWSAIASHRLPWWVYVTPVKAC
jgi:hypothetical protein